PGATLHVAEESTQLPPLPPHCRGRPIRRATVNSHGVSPLNPLACRLQLPTLPPLAPTTSRRTSWMLAVPVFCVFINQNSRLGGRKVPLPQRTSCAARFPSARPPRES